MALIIEDHVLETTTTTGTGPLTLAGAPTGYKAFSSVCNTTDVVFYGITGVDGNNNPTGEWETGLGTYSGTNTLTRTTVHKSSNANAAVTFSAGTKQVFISPTATSLAVKSKRTVYDGSNGTTWTKDPRTQLVRVQAWGAGGGGGSGAVQTSGSLCCGGGAGGGGALGEWVFLASDLSATETVTIGLGGSGGTSAGTTSAAGSSGVDGGTTTFGSHLSAYGGGRSAGGQLNANINGGGGGGLLSNGSINTGAGKGGGVNQGDAAMPQGGASGALANNGAVGGAGYNSIYGGAGGGGGGGVSATPAAFAGGTGGRSSGYTVAQQPLPTGGVVGGALPGSLSIDTRYTYGGYGGGGGASSITGSGQAGGAGQQPGGGGGGGGSNLPGFAPGAGGRGGDGMIVVTEYF